MHTLIVTNSCSRIRDIMQIESCKVAYDIYTRLNRGGTGLSQHCKFHSEPISVRWYWSADQSFLDVQDWQLK